MADGRVERRLSAIFAGDVAGYSRLMGADEEGTLARLNAHRREFLEPNIAEHRGRIVKRTGDGILIEFLSAVDAVRCAIQQQRGMAERNVGVAPDKRIELRVGIHVGDIMVEEGDIFGDGVNIAARLESIAQPGGICISDDAYRQVRGKLDANFQDSGEQALKNIARAVRVYQWQPDTAVAADNVSATPALPDKLGSKPRTKRKKSNAKLRSWRGRSSGSAGNTSAPWMRPTKRRPKQLPWLNLISATSNVAVSWCRSKTSLVAGVRADQSRARRAQSQ